MAQLVKNLTAMWETWVWFLGWADPLEKGKATHSSTLAWKFHGLCSCKECDWATFTFFYGLVFQNPGCGPRKYRPTLVLHSCSRVITWLVNPWGFTWRDKEDSRDRPYPCIQLLLLLYWSWIPWNRLQVIRSSGSGWNYKPKQPNQKKMQFLMKSNGEKWKAQTLGT